MPALSAPGLYIDGEWVPAESGHNVDIINPTTGKPVGSVAAGSERDAHRAIAAARAAFDYGPWARMEIADRTAAMRRFQSALQQLEAEIVDAMVWEGGVVRGFAQYGLVPIANGHLDYAITETSGGLEETLPITTVAMPDGSSTIGCGIVIHEPIGVVAALVPFNGPHMPTVGKLAGALATGNTVVLKPSPLTPFGALLLARAAEMAELPPGVLNVVTGAADVGGVLTTSAQVDMISFTGSDAVGTAIMAQSAPTLKKVVLELGGKSAQIVLPDADLESAARSGAVNFVTLAGQGCSHRTRHIVHRSVMAEYVEALVATATAQVIGDPDTPGTTMGPLISESQRARVERYVAVGRQDGATVVCGGARPRDLEQGYFFQPTVLVNVANGDRVAQEEIFGPVAVVIGFDSDEEAIAIANDSPYGLSGAVWSRDAGRAFAIARRIRTGQVHVNGGAGTMTPVAPFGGYKRSGLGREYGRTGLLEYTETKYIGFHAG